MKWSEIREARKNPEVNTKENIVDKLLEYADDPRYFVHTSPIAKVGMNPKTSASHDTPLGVYAFNLTLIQHRLESMRDYALSMILPYYGGDHVFVIRATNPVRDTLKTFTEADLSRAVEKLKTKFDPEFVDKALEVAPTNITYVKHPIGKLWGMTKAIAIGGTTELDHEQYPNPKKWNWLLRFCGLTDVHDFGYSFIHNAENTQSVFLTPDSFQIMNHFNANMSQGEVVIGGKKYRGGRIPSILNLDSINHTELANIKDGAMLKKVKEINIKQMSGNYTVALHNIFQHAQINVENMFITGEYPMIPALSKRSIVKNVVFVKDYPLLTPVNMGRLDTFIPRVENIIFMDKYIDFEHLSKKFPTEFMEKVRKAQ